MTNLISYLTKSSAPNWNEFTAAALDGLPLKVADNVVELSVDGEQLSLTVFEHGVRLKTRSEVEEHGYGMLVSEVTPQTLDLQHTSNQDLSIIRADELVVEIAHNPFSLSVKSKEGRLVSSTATDGHFVRRFRVPPLLRTDGGWMFTQQLRSGEAVYGLGEKWGRLDKRGQLIQSFNVDALGVNAEISYKNKPFCWSPDGWGVFVHTAAPVTHAVGFAPWSQRTYCAVIEDPKLDLFIFIKPAEQHKNVAAEMIRAYTDLTGRAPLPPVWSGGVILSKAYYQDPEELLAVAREVRERNMPCDTITIDGRAWQDTKTRFAFEWDQSRWPDPKAVLDQIKALGFKVCIWEYPLISTEHPWFAMFAEKGWLLTDKRTGEAYQYDWDQQAFGQVLTPLPKSGLVDFTHPEAYAFWRDAHKPLFDVGVDMIKADFGEQLEDDNMLASNGASGIGLHNVYAHLYNRCVFEAAELYSHSGAFLFSRSSWIGCQRFNSQWGGDPQADWEGMMGNIRGGLSWGLSGAPFYATDIGGFYKDTRDDALYIRWAQAAVFSAHYRLHGIGAREPWSYSSTAESIVMRTLECRYRLQHYLQGVMQNATKTGLPVQRPMVLAFPQEKQAWAFENQFMFGEDIFVAPCFNETGFVEYYLPTGDWHRVTLELEASEAVSGGRVISEVLNLDQLAVFVRAGCSLPVNHPVQSTEYLKVDEHGLIIADAQLSF